ncbi:MAG TPA: hypothetical protein VME19_13335 [Streptosporangiaceae bacterium]|jgi:hypothetical protein|nr:hypothetical protein [Streptosporangiaceae bacterium]
MKTGMGLVLIGIGAIFAFAVTTNTSVFNLHTAGYVIMIIGVLGLAVPRRGYGWVGRRLFVRQARWRPGNRVEEVVTYPAYVSRNPANTRVQAGLPAPGALGSREAGVHVAATRDLSADPAGPRPGETEIIEDVYEQ